MQTLSEIRAILAERGLRPKRRLGQNFLHDKNQLAKLISAANVGTGDVVLEVGPGTGTLTEALLEAGAEVIASEIDDAMADIIAERLGASPRLTIIRGDCLARGGGRQLAPALVAVIAQRPFTLVANLPYQIASPLMSTLMSAHPNCGAVYVTIQREVADRLLAPPSTKAYGPLTIIVRAFATVERLGVLAPGCFWPPPEVTSAMVAIRRCRDALVEAGGDEARAFTRFVTDLFTRRRKQLGAAFGRDRAEWAALAAAGVSPELRPEALDVGQVVKLWRAFDGKTRP